MGDIRISSRDLVTVKEAAELLGVARLTIYRWIKKNKIISVLLGKSRAIPRSEIKRLKTQ